MYNRREQEMGALFSKISTQSFSLDRGDPEEESLLVPKIKSHPTSTNNRGKGIGAGGGQTDYI